MQLILPHVAEIFVSAFIEHPLITYSVLHLFWNLCKHKLDAQQKLIKLGMTGSATLSDTQASHLHGSKTRGTLYLDVLTCLYQAYSMMQCAEKHYY